jgi:hypothetical protein
VPPCVWYGMTYSLIRDVVESVSCSDEWEVAWSFAQAHMMQEGLWYRILPWETLALLCTTLAIPGMHPIVNLYNGM